MTIDLQELDKARVGFSSYPISENNPAPAVSLARTSMSTEFGVNQEGNVIASGKVTLYAFWEAFTDSGFKIKLKFTPDVDVGSQGEMKTASGEQVHWSCKISSVNRELEDPVLGYQGRFPTDITLEDIYGHESTFEINSSNDWVKSGSARLDFFTEDVELSELASSPYYGSFRIQLTVN